MPTSGVPASVAVPSPLVGEGDACGQRPAGVAQRGRRRAGAGHRERARACRRRTSCCSRS